MKILLVVESRTDNTFQVADTMAKAGPITVTTVRIAKTYNMSDYDIVGLGSGIHHGKHDKKILSFAEEMNNDKGYTFVISTSGGKDYEENNKTLVDILEKKNKTVLGTFSCLGKDTFAFLKLIGGINKTHPDLDDLKNAENFITDIMSKYNELNKQ